MRNFAGHGGTTPGGGFAFVGRERELGLLLAALRHPPAVVLIEGEGGIGKSRLIREAAATLIDEGGHVLTGYCHPLREPVPFGPVIDALSKAKALLPGRDAIAPSAGALAPLLPDLADRLPPPPARAQDAAERHSRMQGVRSFLSAIGPVVLVIEDMHWVDEVTRELLLQLSRDMPEQLRLVLTFRAEDLRPGTPLLGSAFRRQPGTSGAAIHLSALTEHDVSALAHDALGEHADNALVQVLYARSGGVPLVAEEDLITLSEHGRHGASSEAVDLAADLERADLPHGLREALTERLAALSSAGRAIAETAAVLAVPTSEVVLTRVAGLSAEEGASGITEALRACVLRERAEARYAFRHVLAQQVVYQQVSGPLRSRLHERAIEVLETESPPPLVQIAHHTLKLGDRGAWLTRAEAAAGQAVAFGDAGTAAALFQQILGQPDLPPVIRARVATALAGIVVDGLDYTTNAAMLRRILSDPQLPTAARGDIRLSLGLLMANHGGDSAGFREIARAAEELAERPERAARAMIALAMHEQDNPAEQAWTWMHRADLALRKSPDEAMRVAADATRLTLMAREGDPKVWGKLDELPRTSQDNEILRQTTRALYNVGDLAVDLGHDKRATTLLAESRELARQAGSAYLESYSLIDLVRLEGLGGDWAHVEQRFVELLDKCPDIAMCCREQALLVGVIAAARGERTRARKLFDEAAASAEAEPSVTVTLRSAAARAALRLAEGAPADAWAIAAPAVATLRRAEAWARGTGLVPVAVEAALACGERDYAEGLAADAESGVHERDAPAASAEAHLARAAVLGTSPKAAEHFERARQLWTEIGRPYQRALATERLGVALAATHPGDATAFVDEAVAEYNKLGADYDAARCQSRLRELGLRQPARRGRRGYGDLLSPRELQIAELLAEGATNRNIAETLFLSPRTVEQHVAHILKKLGAARKDVREALRSTQR